jgi:hypothetical protein
MEADAPLKDIFPLLFAICDDPTISMAQPVPVMARVFVFAGP